MKSRTLITTTAAIIAVAAIILTMSLSLLSSSAVEESFIPTEPSIPEAEAAPQEEAAISDSPLLSKKPVIYAANLSEEDFMEGYENNPFYQEVKAIADEENSAVLPICAKIEEDIADMTAEEKMEFLADLNLTESGLNRIIKEGYELLGLISFLTSGEDECRAWTITRGTKAPKAAGKIHTDFERGFIRAEVISFEDLMACGSMAAAKEKGLVRLEGKEYVMKDGDIVLFRFNV